MARILENSNVNFKASAGFKVQKLPLTWIKKAAIEELKNLKNAPTVRR